MFPVPLTPTESVYYLHQIGLCKKMNGFMWFLCTLQHEDPSFYCPYLVFNAVFVCIWWNGAMFVWVGAADVAPLTDGKSYRLTDVAAFFLPPPSLISVVF